MKTVELQEKTVQELHDLLEELTREQVNLRVQKATNQLTAPHRLRFVRRNIARVKTLITVLAPGDDMNQLEKEEVA